MGAPKYLLQLVILADEIKDDLYFTGVPRFAWRAFMVLSGMLARLGGLLGYEARHPDYGGTG